MKNHQIRLGDLVPVSLSCLMAVTGCGQSDSSYGGERPDAHQGEVIVELRPVTCEQGPVTGDRCMPLPAGKVCRRGDSCLGGCAPDCSCDEGVWSCEMTCRDCMGPKPEADLQWSKGPHVCSVFCNYEGPRLDAGVAAPDGADGTARDGSVDGTACRGANPAKVDCLVSSDQCVPSSCTCSQASGWACTADCRKTTLPLCDRDAGADARPDSSISDAAPDVSETEASSAANYACRDDSDCCIVVDTCRVVAHLYSKAPGATGRPSIPSAGGTCVPCIAPAVQVRCELGQCVGEKLTTGIDYGSSIRKDHCGPVPMPDAGPSISGRVRSDTQPASWGC